jgi:hypothetical protein
MNNHPFWRAAKISVLALVATIRVPFAESIVRKSLHDLATLPRAELAQLIQGSRENPWLEVWG